MTREELIKKVALKMDEISSSDDVIVPVDTGDNNPLYTQINNLLNESINDVLMKAPVYRIKQNVKTLSNPTFGSTKDDLRRIAIFHLPDSFLRLVSITSGSWDRPITELAFEGDAIAKRQHNKYLIAKSSKPVAVLGRDAMGDVSITCYSFDSDATVNATLFYVERYNSDTNSVVEVNLDDYMIDIVSWVCAGRVFAAQGDNNKGKICDENAAALMI